MARLCWNCSFFVADNAESLLSGVCRRHAPRGSDFQAFGIAHQLSYRVEMGCIDGVGTVYEDAVIPLFLSGGLPTGMRSCPPDNLTGLDANDVMPAVITSDAYDPIGLEVCASRMCSGAASVGAAPVLHVQAVQVNGPSCLSGWSADVPITPAKVTPKDSVTDIFVREYMALNLNGFTGMLGLRLDLTGATPNDIAQVRNLKIAVVFSRRDSNIAVDPITSKAKWATIANGSNTNCGEFKPLEGIVPPIPTV